MEYNEQSETEKIQNYEDAVAEGKNSMRRKQKERYVRKKRKKLKRLKAFFLQRESGTVIPLYFLRYKLLSDPDPGHR